MKFMRSVSVFIFALAAILSSWSQNRVVLGGKAVIMVADAAYLFPGMAARVAAVAGADQGLGIFLAALDPGFGAKPVLDRSAGAEAYAALKPDSVLMKSSMRKTLGPSLDALGIRQLYVDLETPDDYLRDIAALGAFFGEKARADALVAWYRGEMDSVAAKIAGISAAERPRVLVVQAGADASWEVPPAQWMQTILVELAGGIPVWKGANPGAGWAKVNPEQIAAWNPDVIFAISYREDSGKTAAALKSDARLSPVAAVRKGAVFGFPQDFYSWDQPDTRWILGLEWAAKRLHPQRFAELRIDGAARGFFAFCYGLDASAYDRLVKPRLAGDYGD